MQNNHEFHELNEFLEQREQTKLAGGSIREIRYKSVFCAQPKIRKIRGRKKFRSIRTIRCSKKIRVICYIRGWK